MPTVRVRLALPSEGPLLSDLAMRAKASWGYDAAFMERCRAELTLTPDKMATWTIWAADYDGKVAGMIALAVDGDKAELEDFMVEPGLQGEGIGRALMGALVSECRRLKLQTIGLDADPNAEPIYQRFGFATVGHSPSKSIPGRMLPRMVRAI